MRYILAFKKKVVKRFLPPNDDVRAVAKEMGVSENSIYIWIKKLKEGIFAVKRFKKAWRYQDHKKTGALNERNYPRRWCRHQTLSCNTRSL